MKLRKRFDAKVKSAGEDDCWLWTGASNVTGYGHIWVEGRMQRAHRVAWILANNRPIPWRKVILHSCDQRLCVNPKHLRVGTQEENIHDAISKGRFPHGYRRLDYCKRGLHRLEPGNLYFNKRGKRQCLACMKIAKKRYRLRAKHASDERPSI